MLTTLFICNQCTKPCVENQIAVFKLTPEELKINPYMGNEILTYKNFKGDSIVFPQGDRKTYVEEVHKISPSDAKEYYNGCEGDYFDKDRNMMKKFTENFQTRFDINLFSLYTFDNPTNNKEFELNFYADVNSQPDGDWFNGHFLFKVDTIFNRAGLGDSIVSYHSMFSIGPKTFFNVYELFCVNPDDRNNEWFSIAYYSIKTGLVGFKTNNGITWYLDKDSK